MPTVVRAAALALAPAVTPALAQEPTATELEKELPPEIRKAEAEGRDLGEAAEEYKAGNEALMQGKAKAAMPVDGQ